MYDLLKEKFKNQFGNAPKYIFSAPGRSEISGNHTDHQHGYVMAAAVNRETVAAVGRLIPDKSMNVKRGCICTLFCCCFMEKTVL